MAGCFDSDIIIAYLWNKIYHWFTTDWVLKWYILARTRKLNRVNYLFVESEVHDKYIRYFSYLNEYSSKQKFNNKHKCELYNDKYIYYYLKKLCKSNKTIRKCYEIWRERKMIEERYFFVNFFGITWKMEKQIYIVTIRDVLMLFKITTIWISIVLNISIESEWAWMKGANYASWSIVVTSRW